jgi:TRAP-type C4-dicarboxylate transport system permease small subunit
MRRIGENLEKNLIELSLAAIAVFMLAEALCRHLAPGIHAWPLKAAGGCLAWMASLGIARAAALGLHVKMAVLPLVLAEKGRRRLERLADAVFLLFSLVSLAAGCVVLVRSILRPDSPGHPLVYAAIPVGSALSILRLWERLRRGEAGGRT